MNSLYTAAQTTGWGTDLQALAVALASALILLLLIAKVPVAVAAICGVSAGGAGGHGVSSLFSGAGIGAQIATGVGGVAAAGGRALGSAVRNAVRQGQALSRGR
jgi:H+/Cl- antiporter ClcA